MSALIAYEPTQDSEDKARRVMSLVFKHGQRYGLIPRNQESNPLLFVRCKIQSDYEAIILTAEQAFTAAGTAGAGANVNAVGCWHWTANLGMLGLAVAGSQLHRIMHPRTSYMDVRRSGTA